jgi:hypothetical protein
MEGQRMNRPMHRVVVATAMALCAVAMGGCETEQTGQRPAGAPGPAASTNYFGDASFIGRTVTVGGIVTRVITETSFVLDTRDFGDESLLVLCAPSREVAVGYRVSVSGNVQKFDYSAYTGEYALASDADRYRDFAGEEFLVTSAAMKIERSEG